MQSKFIILIFLLIMNILLGYLLMISIIQMDLVNIVLTIIGISIGVTGMTSTWKSIEEL